MNVFCCLFLQLVTGYRIYLPKLVVNYIFTIISLGFLQLVFYWKPVWHLKCTSTKCQLREATVVLIQVCWFCFCNLLTHPFVCPPNAPPLPYPLPSVSLYAAIGTNTIMSSFVCQMSGKHPLILSGEQFGQQKFSFCSQF